MKKDKSSCKLGFGVLSKFRNLIYGVSIGSVVIFHYFQVLRNTNSIFAPIAKLYEAYIGSVGVDIFFIMSGISMYYSLNKSFNEDRFNLIPFYIKRIKRLLVPYVLVAVTFWYIIDIVLENRGYIQFIKDITFYSFFESGERSIWYILAIIVFYFICPFIYLIMDRFNKIRGVVFVFLIVSMCGINWLLFDYQYDLYCNIEIMLTRFPAFILGMYIGKKVAGNVPLNKLYKVGIGLFAVVDFVMSSLYLTDSPYAFLMLRRYIQILRAVVILAVISYVFNKYGDRMKTRFLKRGGELSLEIYLVHVGIFEVMKSVHIRFEEIFMFFIYVGLTIVLVKSLHKWSNIITNKLFKNG